MLTKSAARWSVRFFLIKPKYVARETIAAWTEIGADGWARGLTPVGRGGGGGNTRDCGGGASVVIAGRRRDGTAVYIDYGDGRARQL